MGKKVVLVPLDPVHDIGLKMIRRGLEEAGHEPVLLPPDLPVEEIVATVESSEAEVVMASRTVGYQVAERLANLVDVIEAAGLRGRVTLAVGGMAIRPQLAAELGYDAGFGPGTTVAEAVAFVEGRPACVARPAPPKTKADLTAGYSYAWREGAIQGLLDDIVDDILGWAKEHSSPGVARAELRREMVRETRRDRLSTLRERYSAHCDPQLAQPANTRRISDAELESLAGLVDRTRRNLTGRALRHVGSKPAIFVQYGTGCPFMDSVHIKATEAWGADGVVHFDPSWAARMEGLAEGHLAHQGDGSLITPENLRCIRGALEESTIWQVRAHRGLNTAETVALAGELGADLTKINIVYGALGAGTDPARMTVDGVAAIRLAAEYGLPFDVVTNEELCGVPAHKAFAGMLIVAALGIRLGGRPILQPLFCYSPQVMVEGQMEDNYIDFNSAKIMALRSFIDAPIWPGAPIGFLTHTEDRVQSAVSTGLHAILAASLGVDAITIASTDEAYSGGPIAAASRIDTLNAVAEGFRFLGSARVQPTARATDWAGEIRSGIIGVLKQVRETTFVKALYEGVLGSQTEGAYPGRAGRGTVYPV